MAGEPLVAWLDEVSRKHGLGSAPVASGAAPTGSAKNLEAEYDKLGGDAALDRWLAEEDKLFRVQTESLRAHIKRWQKDRLRELDEHERAVQGVLKDETTLQAPIQAWVGREKPLVEKITVEVKALGPKLETERGKELLTEINGHTEQIRQVEIAIDYNERSFKVHRALKDSLAKRYADVDRVYESFERIVRDARTELDNELQKSAMSLEEKVKFLREKPKIVEQRMKQARDTLDQNTKASIAGTMKEKIPFEPPAVPTNPPAIDWSAIQGKLDALKAASIEDLKKADPALEKLRRKYEKAGGDEALFKKRVESWKQDVVAREKRNTDSRQRYEKIIAELQESAAVATRNHERNEENLRALKVRDGEIRTELEALASKTRSDEEEARQQLLQREAKRVKTELSNREKALKASAESKKNAAELIELERQRYEVVVDDDPRSELMGKPKPADIHTLPLKAKHAELTAK